MLAGSRVCSLIGSVIWISDFKIEDNQCQVMARCAASVRCTLYILPRFDIILYEFYVYPEKCAAVLRVYLIFYSGSKRISVQPYAGDEIVNFRLSTRLRLTSPRSQNGSISFAESKVKHISVHWRSHGKMVLSHPLMNDRGRRSCTRCTNITRCGWYHEEHPRSITKPCTLKRILWKWENGAYSAYLPYLGP